MISYKTKKVLKRYINKEREIKMICSWKKACAFQNQINAKDLDKDIYEYYVKVKDLVPLWFFKAIQFCRNEHIAAKNILPMVNQMPGFHPLAE